MYSFLWKGDVSAYIILLFAILLNGCVLVLLLLVMSAKNVVNGKQKGDFCDFLVCVLIISLVMMFLYIMCVAGSV